MFNVSITIPDMDYPDRPRAAEAARRFLGTEIYDHRLQFDVTGEGRTTPIMLAPIEVELPRMLVLSTGHLKQETAQLLEDDAAGIIRHAKGEYGWIIPIIDNPSNDPPPNLTDLVDIFALARVLGATWIMLDRDAELIEGLQSWEW